MMVSRLMVNIARRRSSVIKASAPFMGIFYISIASCEESASILDDKKLSLLWLLNIFTLLLCLW